MNERSEIRQTNDDFPEYWRKKVRSAKFSGVDLPLLPDTLQLLTVKIVGGVSTELDVVARFKDERKESDVSGTLVLMDLYPCRWVFFIEDSEGVEEESVEKDMVEYFFKEVIHLPYRSKNDIDIIEWDDLQTE